jgi:hypothetical protein
MNTPFWFALGLALAVTTPPCSASDLDLLKQRYLACDRDASQRRLSGGEAAACSEVAERLLRDGFDGDLDRQLQWWRSVRPAAAATAALFEQGQAHYEAGRYAQAYALFARLADEGHAEAARIALQMRQWGPRLYGTTFTAGPKQLERWRALLPRATTPRAGAPAGRPLASLE